MDILLLAESSWHIVWFPQIALQIMKELRCGVKSFLSTDLARLTGLIGPKLLWTEKEKGESTGSPSPQVTSSWLTGLLSQAETGLIVMLGALIGVQTNLQECFSALKRWFKIQSDGNCIKACWSDHYPEFSLTFLLFICFYYLGFKYTMEYLCKSATIHQGSLESLIIPPPFFFIQRMQRARIPAAG